MRRWLSSTFVVLMLYVGAAAPVTAADAVPEGAVVVDFIVDTTGRVRSCAVVQSSGYPRLDKQTCDLAMRRFRFDPATDGNGNAVRSTRRQTFRWQLPPSPAQQP